MIDYLHLKSRFENHFKRRPRLFRAPGRVNLIGEHTDYNDGFVLPVAIDRECAIAAAPGVNSGVDKANREAVHRTNHAANDVANHRGRVRVLLVDSNETAEFDLHAPGARQRGSWLDYVEGTAQELITRGYDLRATDLAIYGDVPVGAGLSSSAALEIAIGYALLSIANQSIDKNAKVELALAGQAAEHSWVGANVGVMDQFIAALGEAGHALLIDCRKLEARPVKLDTRDANIAICDSGVKHSLASSEYNTRRNECEQGVALLKQKLPHITALRDVSIEDFNLHQAVLPTVIMRRCRHVVTENRRTLQAAEAFETNDFRRAGQLMYESHDSLRDDYQVSCPELDTLVAAASHIEGVYGARMTGGGFGGCTVNLVANESVKVFQAQIAARYKAAHNREVKIYLTEAMNGVEEIGNF